MKSNSTGKQCKNRGKNKVGRKTLEERFISYLPDNYQHPDMINSCWNWQGGLNADNYGVTFNNGKSIGSHRISYMLFKGTINQGLVIMHTCDNPQCINPKHLLLGTQSDNMKDMVKKGRQGEKRYRQRDISDLLKTLATHKDHPEAKIHFQE